MRFLLATLILAAPLVATTLEKLTFDEMVSKSTAIVRGRINRTGVKQHGPIYYSHYRVQVSEQYKGAAATQFDVVMPGGSIGQTQQTFSGVPTLAENSELVLFLWTSRSGLTHVIGLTQGVFQVTRNSTTGETTFFRDAIREALVDSRTGRPTTDGAMQFSAQEFSIRVRKPQEGVMQ